MNKKTIIILIVILITAIIVGVFWYVNNSQKSKAESQKLTEQKNDNIKKVTIDKIKNIENELWVQLKSEGLTDNRDRKSFIIENVNDDGTIALGYTYNVNKQGGANIFAFRNDTDDKWDIKITQEGLFCSDIVQFSRKQIKFIKKNYVDYCVEFNGGSMLKKKL